jgi:replicative DNA helicase
VAEIRAEVLRALRRHNARTCLVVFDYLQRAAPTQGHKEVRTNVSALAGHLRDLATRLECPVLAISSQNRSEGNYGNGRGSASLTSLKESGDLEYSADSVMFLHQSEQRRAVSPAIAVDLTVSKNRFGPAGSSVPLIFRATVGDFREEAHEAARRT